uniref:Uncharacterized protein n=1 Tax=Coccidioides posadasii RMSCC 3488 TaxID=454284 RepID=A0A0J6IJT5_COCPO|nr:hypothetical protein CPAG_08471 [Coccidioides posadasii RMSCC 3488]
MRRENLATLVQRLPTIGPSETAESGVSGGSLFPYVQKLPAQGGDFDGAELPNPEVKFIFFKYKCGLMMRLGSGYSAGEIPSGRVNVIVSLASLKREMSSGETFANELSSRPGAVLFSLARE